MLRDLWITDSAKGTIFATVWGEAAQKFKSQEKCPIVIRKGIVGEYRERKKINCTFGTLVWVINANFQNPLKVKILHSLQSNPLIPETVPILKWFAECKKTDVNET